MDQLWARTHEGQVRSRGEAVSLGTRCPNDYQATTERSWSGKTL